MNIYDIPDNRNCIDFYEEEKINNYELDVQRYAQSFKEDYIRGKEQYNIAAKPKVELYPVRPVDYKANDNVNVGWPKLWQESWQEMIRNKTNQNTGYDNKVLQSIITKRWGKTALPKKESFRKNTPILLSEKRKLFSNKQVLNEALANNKRLSEAIGWIEELIDSDCCTNATISADLQSLQYTIELYGGLILNVLYTLCDNMLCLICACSEDEHQYDVSNEEDIDCFYDDLECELGKCEDLNSGYCNDNWDSDY